MNVAEYLASFLVKKNIEHVFGYTGSAMLKILDEIMQTGKIAYHQNFHEQAASFCADAYARVSKGIGVILVTSGPGAINALGGIADAYFDSVPMLIISGQDYSYNIIKDKGHVRQVGFQDLDIVSVVRPITKYARLLVNPQDIAYELEKAYDIANTGRKGPVLLDIPIDVQFKELDENCLRYYKIKEKVTSISNQEIDFVHEALINAKRPVILAGGGIQSANASEELDMLIEKINIPVVVTLNGIDAYSQKYGFTGLYGHSYANIALVNADLVLILGARMGQRQVGKKPEEYTGAGKIIQVDIDENELGRELYQTIGIKADLKAFLQALLDTFQNKSQINYSEWNLALKKWKKELYARDEVNKEGIDPVAFIKKISNMIPEGAIITADVGQNQMWVNQGLTIKKKQRVLNSSGYGSMGFSLPAAIGASYANNVEIILAFMGDGGFHMNIQELEYLKIHRSNIKCIIFNNNTLGMMREVQKRYYWEHYYGSNIQDFQCPNIGLLAQAYNLKYLCIEREIDFRAFYSALNDKEPYLIECKIQFESELINRYDEFAELNEIIRKVI